jgi:asparagine synthase (glutamine-hydrolysing)
MIDQETGAVIVFNGEIYNYIELRERLLRQGQQFRTRSDTEVILIGYRVFGPAIVHELNGMFSFSVFDPKQQVLHLFRDRFGEKPLYYFSTKDRFYFASELSALREFPGCPVGLDESAVLSYFALGYIQGPGTIFEGVRQLPHAHQLTVSAKSCQENRYYRREAVVSAVPDVAPDTVVGALSDAIRLRMRADVPVATLLSGGFDSSLITVLAQRHSARPLKTFAFGWRGLVDELPYARQVATLAGTDHTEIELDQGMFSEEFDGVISAMDMPQSDSAAFVVFRLCKEIALRGIKVVLSGEGGDELFGGYPWYQKESSLRSNVKRLLYRRRARCAEYVSGKQVFSEDELREHFSHDVVAEFVHGRMEHYVFCDRDDANERISFDYETLLPWSLLPKVDRMSMAHSVEMRAPFLDFGLVDQWARFPTEDKVRANELKALAKSVIVKENILPASIVYRAKQGMNLPISWWIRENEHFYRDVLGDSRSNSMQLFGRETIGEWFKSLAAEAVDGWSRPAQQIWAATVFDLWFASRVGSLQGNTTRGA